MIPVAPNIISILRLQYGRHKNGVLIQWQVDFDDLPILCVNVTNRNTNSGNDSSFEICN